MKPTDCLTLEGSPRSRGRQQGEQLRMEIRDFYQVLLTRFRFRLPVAATEEALVTYAHKHWPAIRAYAPDLARELEGIAEASGLTLDQIVFINCFDELGSLHHPEVFERLVGPGAPRWPETGGGCTAFAASGAATRDGGMVLGQTYDMSHWYGPFTQMLRILPEPPELECLVLAHPGSVGMIGVNANGLCMTQNTLRPRDTQAGITYPLMVRKTLQQRTLGEAIACVLKAPRATGANYTLASETTAVGLETSATDYEFTYMTGDILAHTNHYLAPHLRTGQELRHPIPPSTLLRLGRITQLLRECHGSIDEQVAHEMLSDHVNRPESICCHCAPDDRTRLEPEGATISGVVLLPAERRMSISDGNPCKGSWASYEVLSPGSSVLGRTTASIAEG